MEHDLLLTGGEEDLLPFLARRVALYTGGDHSSVPKSLALELFASARFILAQGPEGCAGPEERFAAGLAATGKKVAHGRRLWRAVSGSLPKVENRSMIDTLRSMGGFFRRYDQRFFAHQIPCDIDYQLCLAVPDGLEGVDYVNRYLTHLAIENDFINRFDPSRVIALLKIACGDYRGLLVNLYEPVAANALALALAGGDVAGLSVSGEEREELSRLLARSPEALERAAEKLCALLDIRSGGAKRYLKKTASGLLPRVWAADLGGIFPSIV